MFFYFDPTMKMMNEQTNKLIMKQTNKQTNNPSVANEGFDPSEDFANEALELIQQFGYIVLFGSAFPLAFAVAWATNILDLHLDFNKLLHSYRRVAPRQVSDLCFDGSFRALLYVAIPTNVALVVFTYSDLGDLDGDNKTVRSACIYAWHGAPSISCSLQTNTDMPVPKR